MKYLEIAKALSALREALSNKEEYTSEELHQLLNDYIDLLEY